MCSSRSHKRRRPCAPNDKPASSSASGYFSNSSGGSPIESVAAPKVWLKAESSQDNSSLGGIHDPEKEAGLPHLTNCLQDQSRTSLKGVPLDSGSQYSSHMAQSNLFVDLKRDQSASREDTLIDNHPSIPDSILPINKKLLNIHNQQFANDPAQHKLGLSQSFLENAASSSDSQRPKRQMLNSSLSSHSALLSFPPLLHGIPPSNIHGSDRTAHHHAATAFTDMRTATPETDTENAFLKLVPLVNKVNAYNFGDLLVAVLQMCGQDVCLDDFYNLLYRHHKSVFPPSPIKNASFGPSAQNLQALELCSLILETFKNPHAVDEHLRPGIVQNSLLSSVNFHELLRSFLAIKIIIDSLREVQDSSSLQVSLPRLSIYKVYYITCQKLIHKHSGGPKSYGIPQNLILGQSKLGKITKLVYPHLNAKRLGKRGQSRYHYLNLTWNHSTVDHNTLDLLDLDLSELNDHFKNLRGEKQPHRIKGQGLKATREVDHDLVLPPPRTLVPRKPLYSYIKLSSTFPSFDCKPSIGKSEMNTSQQQSQWCKDTINKSVEVLKSYNVNVTPLLQNFSTIMFSDHDPDSFQKAVLETIRALSSSLSEDAYSHLYLVLLSLIFPKVVASDSEVSVSSKIQLRDSLKSCIAGLESKIANMLSTVAISSKIFTRILMRMVRLSETTSSKVKSACVGKVIKVMVNDVDSLQKAKGEYSSEENTLEEIFNRGIIISLNAYHFELINASPTTEDRVKIICHIAKTFVRAVQQVRDSLVAILTSIESDGLDHVTQDVPFQLFELSTKALHEVCLSDPLILQLPIPVITFIILHITNEMQRVSFHDFGNRDPELAKETFKTWWVFSTTFQEYMSVLSEIVALSQSLT